MEKGLASEGVIFRDRACRVEKARANCTFLVRKKGGQMKAFAARALLEEFGIIISCEEVEAGVIVTFKTFDPARDVIKVGLSDVPPPSAAVWV